MQRAGFTTTFPSPPGTDLAKTTSEETGNRPAWCIIVCCRLAVIYQSTSKYFLIRLIKSFISSNISITISLSKST